MPFVDSSVEADATHRKGDRSAGGGAVPSSLGYDLVRNRKSGRCAQGLVDDAEPLGHLDETLHRRGIGVGVQFEGQRDIGKADRRFAIHAERAARVPLALCDSPPRPGASRPWRWRPP